MNVTITTKNVAGDIGKEVYIENLTEVRTFHGFSLDSALKPADISDFYLIDNASYSFISNDATLSLKGSDIKFVWFS